MLKGVRVLDPAAPTDPVELRTSDGRVVALRPAAGPHEGLVVTPAFVDAHVHATATGLLVDGLDLAGCPSPAALLDAVAARARARPGALIWGHGWQDLGWEAPDRAALDRAAAGCPVYLSRVDVHSALVSSALLHAAPAAVGAVGWSDGPLSADAHHHVRRAALGRRRPGHARRGPVRLPAGRRGRRDRCRARVRRARHLLGRRPRRARRPVPGRPASAARRAYWGQAVASAAEARELLAATGAHGLAGDLFVDGSLGSRTAALRTPYADAPGCHGHPYLDADAVGAHVTACTAAGVQAGFHVIGDAAADTLVAGLRRAARRASPAAVRARAHRVEHLEMVDAAQAWRRWPSWASSRACSRCSTPGGAGRPGCTSTGSAPTGPAAMNPFAALHAAGVSLAFGSDAPVTPLGPWAAVRAAVDAPHTGVRACRRMSRSPRTPSAGTGRRGTARRSRVAWCPARPPRTPSGSSGDEAALPAHRPKRPGVARHLVSRGPAPVCHHLRREHVGALSGVLSLLSQLTLRPVPPAASAAPTSAISPCLHA